MRKRRYSRHIFTLIVVSVILVTAGRSVLSKSDVRAESNDDKADSIAAEAKNRQVPDASEWNLTLVNSSHYIPDDYQIDIMELKNGQAVDRRIYEDLQSMMDDARAEGLSPLICSSYRTNEKQTYLYNNKLKQCISIGYNKKEAREETERWVARPGTSEHQLGLAVDIVAESYQILDEAQEDTKEQQWLMKHCARYGFILRYPTDKSKITGIGYEPWHYRYVGREAAKEIMDRGICLEEYLNITTK